jgi:di/tricarboxylate transporter
LIAVRSKDWNNSEAAPVVEDDSEFPNSPSSVGEPEGVELVIASKSNEGLEEDSTIHVEKSNTELMFEKMMGSQVSEHVLHYGDVVLCIANSVEVEKLRGNRDFFVISTVGRLPKPLDLWNSIAVVIFLAMMILVATERIAMCPAALTVTCVYFIGGWIKYDEIPRLINLRLLMLMGCSLSYARAVTKTGLALKIAASISSSNPSSFEAILFVYAITLVITELISNNAAAALMYPIAVALADELKVRSLHSQPVSFVYS